MAKGTRAPKVASTVVEKEIKPQSNRKAKEMKDDSVVVVGMEEPIVPKEEPVTPAVEETQEKPEQQEEPTQDTVVVEPKEEKPTDEKVTATLDAPVDTAKAQTNVRVATDRDHSCVIGGVRYTFYKGKQQPVPVHVKETLMKAGLLLPL